MHAHTRSAALRLRAGGCKAKRRRRPRAAPRSAPRAALPRISLWSSPLRPTGTRPRMALEVAAAAAVLALEAVAAAVPPRDTRAPGGATRIILPEGTCLERPGCSFGAGRGGRAGVVRPIKQCACSLLIRVKILSRVTKTARQSLWIRWAVTLRNQRPPSAEPQQIRDRCSTCHALRPQWPPNGREMCCT